MDEPGKLCVTCHGWQPLSEYNRRAAAADGLQSRCRSCSAAWYQANKAEHKRNVRRRNDEVRRELQALVEAYLVRHACVVCGERDLRVLEFDHRDPASKVDSVGRLQGASFSRGRLLAEMATCDVKCANCHRVRTMSDCGSWRVEAEQQRREREAAVLDDLFAEVMVDCPV